MGIRPATRLLGTVLACCVLLAKGERSEAEEDHWSLRPVERQSVPESANPVDHFIRKTLKAKEIEQSPEADRYTLLRRVTLDLTGLPPSRSEIKAFLSDHEPDAWNRVVDRLLASPHYGERWGRHWLDVARYVQGAIKVPGIDEIDLAAPYRDYVVRSFNEDTPYDQFIAEQLAGDLLATRDGSNDDYLDRIAAPAFLSIGQWFDECTDPNKLRLDIADEQISVTTRAFLALDFACARCHDHKFDPVPTRDYYALAGIFRSTNITEYFSEEWKDGRPRSVRDLALPNEVSKKEKILSKKANLLARRLALLTQARDRVAASRPAGSGRLSREIAVFEAENFSGHKNLVESEVGGKQVLKTRRRLDQWAKYRLDIPAEGDYALLVRYAAAEAAPVKLEINGVITSERVLGESTSGEAAENFSHGTIFLPGLKKGTNWFRLMVDRHEPFPVLDQFRLFSADDFPAPSEVDEAFWPPTAISLDYSLLDESEAAELGALDRDIAELKESIPPLAPSLSVEDTATPLDLPIHTGGDVYRTEGEPIPRGVPSLADHLIPASYTVESDESGRRELADWLSDPKHPLTARVMANRIWHWHFGTGLVRTVDDFGKKGAKPTHPELLDWLASEFIAHEWSVKHLHRIILTSESYRAASVPTSSARERDPAGELLSHFPPRRLEAEAIYDSMLAASGKLERQKSGEPLEVYAAKDRALYILTSSRSPQGLGIEIRKMFPLFGFDDSGRPMHDRDDSTTAQQALWWLNNPLPAHYATKLAERVLGEESDAEARATAAYEIALGRPPSPQALTAFLTYVDESSDKGLTPTEAWARACLGLFSTRSFQNLE